MSEKSEKNEVGGMSGELEAKVERRFEDLAIAVMPLVRVGSPGMLRSRGRRYVSRRRMAVAGSMAGVAAVVVGVVAVASTGSRPDSVSTNGGGGAVAPSATGRGLAQAPAPASASTSPNSVASRPAGNSEIAVLAGSGALNGVTAQQSRDAWKACNSLSRNTPEFASEGGSIVYALPIAANPNEGPAGIGVLTLAKDGKSIAYCRDRSATWADTKDYEAFTDPSADPYAATEAVVVDSCRGAYDLCYPVTEVAPEPSAKNPFTWIDFGHINNSGITRVTVQYGGPEQDATLIEGHWFSTGTLTKAQHETPIVRGYNAEGARLYDSTTDPHYDQAYQ
ncbi:hypothetical protein ABIA31_008911 [Catenulispora sp. MAP5-51]